MIQVHKNGVFTNPEKLIEMLSLRRSGWSFFMLAELYNCDRATLRYQCRKYQIFPEKKIYIKNSKEIFNPKRIVSYVILQLNSSNGSNWIEIDGERVNTGMSYADYLKRVSPYKLRAY